MGCCIAFTGVTKDCGSSIGGIKRAWGACFDNVGKPTIANDMISAIPDTAQWHEFEFRRQTGSVTTTITRDDTNGTLYYESAIVLQFTKQETAKRLEINALAASDTSWIIQDENDNFWYFGFDNPVTLSDGTAETGTAWADFNGYNITLTDVSKLLPYQIEQEAMNEILGITEE